MNYIDMVAIVRQPYYAVRPLTHIPMFLRIEVDTAITRESVVSSLIREQLLEDIEP